MLGNLGRLDGPPGPFWSIWRDALRLSWAVMEACRAVLAALVAFLGRLGGFREPQGGAMAAQGPPKVGAMHATLRDERGGRVP